MATTDLAPLVLNGDRRALARAITLVESGRADHRAEAVGLIEALRRAGRSALRIGLSGTPGVGKSTFVETFGLMLVEQGLKVAVLAVDPSSARNGGSILGDKTRMPLLARKAEAFIRPSPSQAQMGGVARRSAEAVTLCEAAGFDVILIETVGVGQSETLVAGICDLFILLIAPAGGDELQGVKRGIMEIADLILVNKADGDLAPTAIRTLGDYRGALHLLRRRPADPDGFPKALAVSALTGSGIAEAWAEMTALAAWRKAHGHWDARRAEQARGLFLGEVRAGLLAALEAPEIAPRLQDLSDEVASGRRSPEIAAAEMLMILRRMQGHA